MSSSAGTALLFGSAAGRARDRGQPRSDGGDIESFASPQVELGAYQVQIGTPATLSADFTIHR